MPCYQSKPIQDLYSQMVVSAHHAGRDRFCTVRGRNPVNGPIDDLFGVDAYGNTLPRQTRPCASAAFDGLAVWGERGSPPPPSTPFRGRTEQAPNTPMSAA
jgi:hypothetical protein